MRLIALAERVNAVNTPEVVPFLSPLLLLQITARAVQVLRKVFAVKQSVIVKLLRAKTERSQ
jgi:hypothetical protein